MKKSIGDPSYEILENSFVTKCKVCGEEFEKSLQASISSGSDVSYYFACPRCLSEVKSQYQDYRPKEENSHKTWPYEQEFNGEAPFKIIAELCSDNGSETTPLCAYNFGYLRNRPTNTPIPEQCLVCKNVLECMNH